MKLWSSAWTSETGSKQFEVIQNKLFLGIWKYSECLAFLFFSLIVFEMFLELWRIQLIEHGLESCIWTTRPQLTMYVMSKDHPWGPRTGPRSSESGLFPGTDRRRAAIGILPHWRFPESTASIILAWKKFGTTGTLPGTCHQAKLSSRETKTLVREVNENPMVTLADLQRSCGGRRLTEASPQRKTSESHTQED